MSREPVAISTGITTLVTAGFAIATAFGMDLSQQQQTSILGFVAAMILVAGLLTRSKVTPTAKAEAAVETALNTTPGPTGIERQAMEILASTKA